MSGSTMFVTVDFEQLPTAPAATTSSPVAPVSSGSQSCWLAASDGGIFAFGDARFFGSTGSMALNQPIVGMASTPGADGYWLVASDGGLFSFGSAGFAGSTGGTSLPQPIVGMTPTPTGHGYTLASAGGAVYTFGDAAGYGSAAGQTGGSPVVGISGSPATSGYDLATQNGTAFGFGPAGPAVSSAGPLNQPIVAIAALAVSRGRMRNSHAAYTAAGIRAQDLPILRDRANQAVAQGAALPSPGPEEAGPSSNARSASRFSPAAD